MPFSSQVFDPNDSRGISLAASFGGRDNQNWISEIRAAQEDCDFDNPELREWRRFMQSNRGIR